MSSCQDLSSSIFPIERNYTAELLYLQVGKIMKVVLRKENIVGKYLTFL
jgi:hypothetical protein